MVEHMRTRFQLQITLQRLFSFLEGVSGVKFTKTSVIRSVFLENPTGTRDIFAVVFVFYVVLLFHLCK